MTPQAVSFPQPEWTTITNLTPPSRWADLADRIDLVEYGIERHRQLLAHVLDMVQERLPVAPENDELWWQCENLRLGADRLPADVEKLDEMLGELFTKFGPKVKNSLGQRDVQWREGPWCVLAPRDGEDE
jgi:hypothetical protein